MNKVALLSGISALLAFSVSTHADIYNWVNESGDHAFGSFNVDPASQAAGMNIGLNSTLSFFFNGHTIIDVFTPSFTLPGDKSLLFINGGFLGGAFDPTIPDVDFSTDVNGLVTWTGHTLHRITAPRSAELASSSGSLFRMLEIRYSSFFWERPWFLVSTEHERLNPNPLRIKSCVRDARSFILQNFRR